MRSKLASQSPAPASGPVTSSADMLQRTRRMFSASRHRLQAASHELHSLQQFIRFRASRADVAWAAAGIHLHRSVANEPGGHLRQGALYTVALLSHAEAQS